MPRRLLIGAAVALVLSLAGSSVASASDGWGQGGTGKHAGARTGRRRGDRDGGCDASSRPVRSRIDANHDIDHRSGVEQSDTDLHLHLWADQPRWHTRVAWRRRTRAGLLGHYGMHGTGCAAAVPTFLGHDPGGPNTASRGRRRAESYDRCAAGGEDPASRIADD